MKNSFVLTTVKEKLMGFIIEDGKVNEIRCYEDKSLIGNIYVARVSNIVENLDAAFVNISKDVVCYLPFEEIESKVKPKLDDKIVVQVVKDGIKSKRPVVTTKLSLTGKFSVVSLNEDIGVSNKVTDKLKRQELKKLLQNQYNYGGIIRTAALEVSEEDVIDEVNKLSQTLHNITSVASASRIYSKLYSAVSAFANDLTSFYLREDFEVVTDVEDASLYIPEIDIYNDENLSLASAYNLNTAVEKALSPRAYLKSGGYLVIEPTEAMTVIDVNTGKAISGKDKEKQLHKINCEAANETARQLRLRNISGIIIIDFINVSEPEHELELMNELKNALSKDYVQTKVHDITKLGLVEITRKKVHKPLHEILK